MKKEYIRDKSKGMSNSEYLGFLKYFDYDIILTIKDRIQSPLYKQIKYEDVLKLLKIHNFYQIKRLARLPQYTNFRKFLSPFYKNYNHFFSKFLYGEGIPQILCKKRNI